MKKKILVFVILMVCFGSAKSMAQTPLEFNNQLSAITDSLYAKGAAWGTKLSEIAKGSKQFSDLKPLRLETLKYIDEQSIRLKAMKDVSGSYNFRQAVINFLVFEKGYVTDGFTPFEKLDVSTSDEALQTAIDKLTSNGEKEKEYVAKLAETQSEYAKANGFTIETK